MKYGLNSKNDLTRKRLFGYNISILLEIWKIKIKLKIKILIYDFDVYKITIFNRQQLIRMNILIFNLILIFQVSNNILIL